MSAPLRLEDLRVKTGEGVMPGCPSIDTVTASEVASVLSDADLIGELVRRGVLTPKTWQGGTYEALKVRYFTDWIAEPVGSVGETP